jgi:pimeloyl-ACP methyl ester carboxylesterase
LDPDNDDRTNGVHPHYPEYDWATLSVWAWGYYRVVDYLMTLEDVDKNKIVVTGHSRGGKTALLAGAMDSRIAIVVPAGSGAGGCGCLKYMQGGAESLMRITRPDKWQYWFQPRFSDFRRRVERLPFDQHFLKALVAPRPLLCTDGLEDEWANPWGCQQTTEAVREVYKFLGVPERVGNHYRQGGHEHNLEDWEALLDFSDFNFYGKALPSDFYKENFEKVDSLINWKSPVPLV